MNDEAIISQWNIDEYGNPISVKTEQETQVSVGGNLVQLRGIPDEMEGVTIEDKNGNTFFRVENLDEVYDNNYAYYLMKDGNVQFNPSQNGKLLYFKYYSKGVTLLSVSRIYYKDSYDNVVKILEDLIKAGFDALKVLEVFGGAKEVIDRLERDLDNGRALATQLEDVIAEGKPLQENINADITEAKKWKDSLHKDVAEGKILQPQLHQDIIDGRETDANLTQTINSATELDDKIKTTGNASFIIEVDNWITSDDSDWAYMYSLTTSLNSSDLVFKIQEITTKGFEDCLLYSIVKDSNTIAFYTDDKVRTKVIINARQYGGTIQDFSVVNTDLISEGASNKYVTPQEKVNIGTIPDIKQQCELNKLSLEEIKYYVTPEMYGAVGDGITDDTDALNRCIADNPNGIIKSKPYKFYKILGILKFPHNVDFDFSDSWLLLYNIAKGIDASNNEDAEQIATIRNVFIDGMHKCGIGVDITAFRILNLYNVRIRDCLETPIKVTRDSISGRGGLIADGLLLSNTNDENLPLLLNSKAIILDSTDSKINNVISNNFVEHIINNKGVNFINNWHAWNLNSSYADIINDSKFAVINDSVSFSGCYSDTLQYGFYCTKNSEWINVIVNNFYYYINSSQYPSSKNKPLPIYNKNCIKVKFSISNSVFNSEWQGSEKPEICNESFNVSITQSQLKGFREQINVGKVKYRSFEVATSCSSLSIDSERILHIKDDKLFLSLKAGFKSQITGGTDCTITITDTSIINNYLDKIQNDVACSCFVKNLNKIHIVNAFYSNGIFYLTFPETITSGQLSLVMNSNYNATETSIT